MVGGWYAGQKSIGVSRRQYAFVSRLTNR
jgi:hypothetical protein